MPFWLSFGTTNLTTYHSIVHLYQLRRTTKVDAPNSVTYINQTPILSAIWFGMASQTKYKKDTCVNKLRVQIVIVIIGSIVNISVWGGGR
jgi:hypothetical protein